MPGRTGDCVREGMLWHDRHQHGDLSDCSHAPCILSLPWCCLLWQLFSATLVKEQAEGFDEGTEDCPSHQRVLGFEQHLQRRLLQAEGIARGKRCLACKVPPSILRDPGLPGQHLAGAAQGCGVPWCSSRAMHTRAARRRAGTSSPCLQLVCLGTAGDTAVPRRYRHNRETQGK